VEKRGNRVEGGGRWGGRGAFGCHALKIHLAQHEANCRPLTTNTYTLVILLVVIIIIIIIINTIYEDNR
jgi:hypothetical protein